MNGGSKRRNRVTLALMMQDDTTSLGKEGRSGELRNNGSTVESLYANQGIMMNTFFCTAEVTEEERHQLLLTRLSAFCFNFLDFSSTGLIKCLYYESVIRPVAAI